MDMKSLQDKILENFWGINRDMSGRFVEDALVRPVTLYHYTTIGAALEIIGRPGGFAFTDCRFLNDESEFFAGVEVIRDCLRNLSSGTFPEWLLTQISEKIHSKTDRHKYVPYVLSFSSSQDSTPHWMIYGDKKNGGVAIGLNFKKIEREIGRASAVYMNVSGVNEKLGTVLFSPCIYYAEGAMDYEFRKRIGILTDEVFSGFWSAKIEDPTRFVDWCVGKVCQLAALMKTEDFSFEKEWRIVIHPTSEEYISAIRFIGNKPRIIPREMNLLSCVSGGIVAPNGDSKHNKLAIEIAARRGGIKGSFKNSGSTYVG